MSLRSGDSFKPLVDPAKIALWGHSYGGAVVTIATGAGLSPQPAATIDLSGGVLSWASSMFWPLTLISYASEHKNAIYFQQVSNESPTLIKDSTVLPFDAADGNGFGAEMAIFARIAPGAPPFAAHSTSICMASLDFGFYLNLREPRSAA